MNLNLIDKFVIQLNALSIPYVKKNHNKLFFEIYIDRLNYFIFANIEQNESSIKLKIQKDILSTHFCETNIYKLNIFCRIVSFEMLSRFGEHLDLEFNKNTGSIYLCLKVSTFQTGDDVFAIKDICSRMLNNLTLLHTYYDRVRPTLSCNNPTNNNYDLFKIIKNLVLQTPINA